MAGSKAGAQKKLPLAIMKDRFLQSVLCTGIVVLQFYLLGILPSVTQSPPKDALDYQHSEEGFTVYSNRKIPPYTQNDMSLTARRFGFNMRVLVFDGETNEFDIYNLVPQDSKEAFRKNICQRDERIIPFFVHALRTHNPERFTKGSPPFQILFSEMDSVKTPCMNHPEKCETSSWAPIVAFSTVPKNPEILPSVKAFPFNAYVGCLTDWYALSHDHIMDKAPYCYFPLEPVGSGSWENLTNQVFWRGSDFPFLQYMDEFKHLVSGHNLIEGTNLTKSQAAELLLEQWDVLTPRFRAVALSIKAEADAEVTKAQQLPWINCKIVGSPKVQRNHNDTGIPEGFYHLGNYVSQDEMAFYRYQVDFGGYGGTTWVGTVSKLAMPGLLFHHETPMKDWYYDDMKPWVHYVPIQWDLSDLREKYDWAEANPRKAQKIAKAGTDFAMSLMSDDYRRDLYEKLYVEYGREVVKAYQPSRGETVDSIVNQYVADGFSVYRFSNKDLEGNPKSCWENALNAGHQAV